MINVHKTILNTIVHKVNELRYHGHNDPKCWKKLLYLVVLDDMYDWSSYLEDDIEIQIKLKNLRTNFILNNPMFSVVYQNTGTQYTNVNSPQNNDTWRRVTHTLVSGVQLEDSEEIDLKPDFTANCNRELIILPTSKIKIENGKPIVFKQLTNCEKMNIYLDSEKNQAWYLNQNGVWTMLNSNSEWSEETLIQLIKDNQGKGVSITFEDDVNDSYLTFDAPNETGETNTVRVLDSDDVDILDDMFKD